MTKERLSKTCFLLSNSIGSLKMSSEQSEKNITNNTFTYIFFKDGIDQTAFCLLMQNSTTNLQIATQLLGFGY